MSQYSFNDSARILWRGLILRCPNCGQGKVATGLFRIEPMCSHCGVRFERQSGESVGGMYLNLGLAELTSIGGFFIVHALFQPPFEPHIAFWVVYNLLFMLLFYRHARSLWVSISYLTGGVKTDAEYAETETKRGGQEVRSPYRD